MQVLGHGCGARRPSMTGVLVQAVQKSVEFPQVPFLQCCCLPVVCKTGGPDSAGYRGVSTGAVLGQVVACPCGARQAVGPDSAETEFPQVAVLGQGVACPLLCMPEVMVCSSDVEQIVASCHRSWIS